MSSTGQRWQLPFTADKRDIWLHNARIFDPESGLDEMGALYIKDGVIADFGAHLNSRDTPEGASGVDCGGNLLSPGLIDIQVHFREPGQEYKETLHTGSKSAAAGGITMVVCQPNTTPVMDDISIVESLKQRARDTSYINIRTYAAVTKGMKGKEITEMGLLKDTGIVAGFTDDGLPVGSSIVMRRAFEYSRELGLPIAQHAEDLVISDGGAINEGAVSTVLGVKGIANASESIVVARDLELLELTGGHYHVLHVSTRQALRLIEDGKKRGLNVTCEVAPHHFTLTDEAVYEHGSLAKMNPPLRSEADRAALVDGLKRGVVDAIATDHAPHDDETKDVPLARASFGIVGVEAMLPLSLALYHDGTLSLRDFLARMTYRAADIISEHSRGRLKKGAPADLTLIDLNCEWTYKNNATASKSTNSPYDGMSMRGRAVRTFVDGVEVYRIT